MQNEIPLSIIHKRGFDLLYFDTDQIKNSELINRAYVQGHSDTGLGTVGVHLNTHLSQKDKALLSRQHYCRDTHSPSEFIADTSEAVKQIASGCVENNGIILKHRGIINDPRLLIAYKKNIIYPRYSCPFYEKEVYLFGRQMQFSPWFFTGMSKTITFFAENTGPSTVTVYLENSPDAQTVVKDPGRYEVMPNETITVIPYWFSKFTRLVAVTSGSQVSLKVWFQTQLMNQ